MSFNCKSKHHHPVKVFVVVLVESAGGIVEVQLLLPIFSY